MTHGRRPGHRMPRRRLPRRTADPGITGTRLTCRNPGRPAHRRLARRRPAHRRLARGRPARRRPARGRLACRRPARGETGPEEPWAAGPGPGRGRDQHARNARCPRMAGAPVASSPRGAARPGRALAADGETEVAATTAAGPRRPFRTGTCLPGRPGAPADGTHLVAAQAGPAEPGWRGALDGIPGSVGIVGAAVQPGWCRPGTGPEPDGSPTRNWSGTPNMRTNSGRRRAWAVPGGTGRATRASTAEARMRGTPGGRV